MVAAIADGLISGSVVAGSMTCSCWAGRTFARVSAGEQPRRMRFLPELRLAGPNKVDRKALHAFAGSELTLKQEET
jgi:hypothetical protein